MRDDWLTRPFRTGLVSGLGAGLAVALLLAVRSASAALLLILMSWYAAVGLDPFVRALTVRGLSRRRAVFAVAAGTVLLLGAMTAALGPAVDGETRHLVRQLPALADAARRGQGPTGALLHHLHLSTTVPADPARLLRAVGGLHGLLSLGVAAVGAVVVTVLAAVLTLLIMLRLPEITQQAYRLLPRSRRPRAGLLLDEMVDRVGRYVLGCLLVSAVMGLGTLVVLLLTGVPYPFALAAFVAVVDLVPVVGSTLGAIAVTAVALTVSVPTGLIVLGYYLVYRLGEDYLLIPRVMNKAVDVPAIVVILAVLLGAAAAGIVGALLAVPTAAAIRLTLTEVVYPALDQR